jgi:hypothetical protein
VDEKEEKEIQESKKEKPDKIIQELIKNIKKKEITSREEIMEILDTINMPLKQRIDLFNLYSKTYLGKTLEQLLKTNEKDKKVDSIKEKIAKALD